MSRNGLYRLLGVACLLGLLYLGISYYFDPLLKQAGWHACFMRNMTGYPCPSCGTTRSVKLLFGGDICGALLMNPMGLIVGLLMMVIPALLVHDLILRKQVLYQAYQAVERTIMKNKWLAVVLAILILLNWIWNINKNL